VRDTSCIPANNPYQAARGKLDLGGIGMTVIPLEVFKLFDLKALWLHENNIQEIPPEIADLTALTQLRVNNNELRVLPAAVSELQALQVLWLQHNSFSVFPSEILALTNLTALSVSSNPLLFIPHQLCLITSIRDLHVEGELLTSPPPKVAARGTSAIMECVLCFLQCFSLTLCACTSEKWSQALTRASSLFRRKASRLFPWTSARCST
jgi:Leucine-rich repeat (LRR) protein